MDKKNFEKPEYYVNRELSWLKFDDRVLSEAQTFRQKHQQDKQHH